MSNANALIEMMKKKRQEMGSNREDFRPFKPAQGKTIIRILPPWRKPGVEGSDTVFWHDFGQHWVKAMDGGKQKIQTVYTCPDKTFGTECEICAAVAAGVNHAQQLGDEDLEELVRQSSASSAYLLNVLVLSHPDTAQRSIPVTMQVGKTIFDGIAEILVEYAEEGVVIYDLDKGVDLIINRTGSGREGTKYTVNASPKGSRPAGKIKGEIPDLDAIVAAQLAQNSDKRALGGVAKACGLPAPAVGSPAAAALEAPVPGQAPTKTLVEEATDVEYEEVEAAPASEPETKSSEEAELEDMLAEFDL